MFISQAKRRLLVFRLYRTLNGALPDEGHHTHYTFRQQSQVSTEVMKGTKNIARGVEKVQTPHIAMQTRARHLRCVTPAACVTFEGILAVLPTFAGCSVFAFDIWFLPSHFHSSSVVL